MQIHKLFFAAVCTATFVFMAGCTQDQSFSPVLNGIAEERAPTSTEYPLASVSDPDISGTVTFQKTGNMTKVTIVLDGTSVGNSHPAHIHNNSVAEGGGVAVPLTSVNGASGRSVTMVDMAYEDLISFDGHVNVHLSADQITVYIAQGNIGSNY